MNVFKPPESSCGQQPGGPVVVVVVTDGCQRVGHLVVDHGIHAHGDRVPGQDLLGGNIKGSGSQINTP